MLADIMSAEYFSNALQIIFTIRANFMKPDQTAP